MRGMGWWTPAAHQEKKKNKLLLCGFSIFGGNSETRGSLRGGGGELPIKYYKGDMEKKKKKEKDCSSFSNFLVSCVFWGEGRGGSNILHSLSPSSHHKRVNGFPPNQLRGFLTLACAGLVVAVASARVAKGAAATPGPSAPGPRVESRHAFGESFLGRFGAHVASAHQTGCGTAS